MTHKLRQIQDIITKIINAENWLLSLEGQTMMELNGGLKYATEKSAWL